MLCNSAIRLYVNIVKEENMAVAVSMNSNQKVLVSCVPNGAIDDVIEFEVMSGDCTIERQGGLSAFVLAGAPDTQSVIEVSADINLGSGVQLLTDQVNVSVVQVPEPMVSDLGLSVGMPQDK